MRMCHFRAQNTLICPEKKFLEQTIIITYWPFSLGKITLIYLLAPFIVQNFKKFFLRIQSYEDAQFLGPNGPFPKWEFLSENLIMSLFLSLMPIYMPKIKVRY